MMKHILLWGLMLLGWTAGAQKTVLVECRVDGDFMNEIGIYKVENGQCINVGTGQLDQEGYWAFQFHPAYEGFYVVGDARGTYQYPLYLKPGDRAGICIADTTAWLEGKNTPENRVLYDWVALAGRVRTKAVLFYKIMSTYKDFFPDFEQFLEAADRFKTSFKTRNREFNDMMRRSIDFEKDYYALNFIYTPRTSHPQKSERPEFYKTIIDTSKYRDDVLLRMPYGNQLLRQYAMFAAMETDGKYTYEKSLTFIPNQRLRGELVLDRAARCRTYADYDEIMQKYGKWFTTEQRLRAEKIGSGLYDTKAGNAAADFTYPDVNGKEVSLSDFKGKVVLVDVWATWCGPCRGEIPHLKKLEEEMHGTDVVFIGVSVDEAKDKQKWLDFIKKEALGGIQLLASGWSKITKDYKIKGIPRFMVFDRKGNIVSVDAPRPSNPELKQLLEAELKK